MPDHLKAQEIPQGNSRGPWRLAFTYCVSERILHLGTDSRQRVFPVQTFMYEAESVIFRFIFFFFTQGSL
jgi:hypothetical protein